MMRNRVPERADLLHAAQIRQLLRRRQFPKPGQPPRVRVPLPHQQPPAPFYDRYGHGQLHRLRLAQLHRQVRSRPVRRASHITASGQPPQRGARGRQTVAPNSIMA